MGKKGRARHQNAIGPYAILKRLGGGGNADVYHARHKHHGDVALKVLRRTYGDGPARFEAEIDVVAKIGPHNGVVLHLDANRRAIGDQPPWIAMPLLRRLADTMISPRQLDEVVTVAFQVAATLADLADRSIHHRDIKPQNLLWDGNHKHAIVADFGLVTYPDKNAMTAPGHHIGPANFIPNEVFANPDAANPGPVDVFALGKTIFCLATERRWPPQGELRADNEDRSISGVGIYHPYVVPLDRLLERMTDDRPERRPTMREVSAELDAIRRAPLRHNATKSIPPVLQHAVNLATHRLKSQFDARRRIIDLATETFDTVTSAEPTWQTTMPAIDGFRWWTGPSETPPGSFSHQWWLAPTGPQHQEINRRHYLAVLLPLQDGPDWLHGIVAQHLRADGTVALRAGIAIFDSERQSTVTWTTDSEAYVGSAQHEQALRGLLDAVRTHIPDAIARIAQLFGITGASPA